MKCSKCGGNVLLVESEMKLKVYNIDEAGFPEELNFPDEAEYKEKNFNTFLWCESCNERFEMTVSDNPEYANAYDVGTRKDDYMETENLVKSKWKAFWKSDFWSSFLKVSGVLTGMAVGIGVFVLIIFGIGNAIDSVSVTETSSDSLVSESYEEEQGEDAPYSGVYDATVIEMKKETGIDTNKYIVRIDVEGYDVLNVEGENLYLHLKEGDVLKVKIGASDIFEKCIYGGEASYSIYKDDVLLTTVYGGWKGE